ncbi:unnamed protein product, partial [Polarella glacialis]
VPSLPPEVWACVAAGLVPSQFIKENELNDSAASRLRGVSSEVRDGVLAQGSNVIDNARNASAVVISRIKKMEDSLRNGGGRSRSRGGGRSRSRGRSPPRGGGGGGGGPEVRAGDWYCADCDAHNFARRNDCFKCNVPRSGGGGGRGRGSRDRGRSRSRSRSRK